MAGHCVCVFRMTYHVRFKVIVDHTAFSHQELSNRCKGAYFICFRRHSLLSVFLCWKFKNGSHFGVFVMRSILQYGYCVLSMRIELLLLRFSSFFSACDGPLGIYIDIAAVSTDFHISACVHVCVQEYNAIQTQYAQLYFDINADDHNMLTTNKYKYTHA